MLILKVNLNTEKEREVEIVTARGLWESGIYKLFNPRLSDEVQREYEEHTDDHDPDYLGAMNVNKENAAWEYRGKQLTADEQKEVADFILDYQPPDGVY